MKRATQTKSIGNQRGVALVITLLMLSVVTVVAVAFLALSRRERSSVTGTISQRDARFASDSGLERAKAQITAAIQGSANMLAVDYSVSRSFINPLGFQPGVSSFTNVSYVYANGQQLNIGDFLQNLTNLWYDPPVPVFVRPNRTGTPPASEFRYFVDLNRNGAFETNGYFLPLDNAGQPIGTEPSFFVGEPEWIGVLEKPNLPHSANNRFIGRYAYIIVPVGKTLDLNFIHNLSQQRAGQGNGSGQGAVNYERFVRNEGFGTYEINLAAFLYALNTNLYPVPVPYSYALGPNGPVSQGDAFRDARSFLEYRYIGDYNQNFDSVQAIFGATNAPRFATDRIDGLAHDQTNPEDDPLWAWPGADRPPD